MGVIISILEIRKSESKILRYLSYSAKIFMYTLLYLKWITNKDLLYSTGNPAQYYVTT